ncbi:hypothetical protein BDZ45DRAFT_752709 [Acephala macrosclerotiorum]|nr:hypothetical protein BDZ45DRAFT_752709 [Acephala macrosclerotiorum]
MDQNTFAPTTFTRFSELPAELRLQIWDEASRTENGRVFELQSRTHEFIDKITGRRALNPKRYDVLFVRGGYPSILSTNHESRTCALKRYTNIMQPKDDIHLALIPFDCDNDVLFIKDMDSIDTLRIRATPEFLQGVKLLAINSRLIGDTALNNPNLDLFENLETIFIQYEATAGEWSRWRRNIKDKLCWTAANRMFWNKDFYKHHIVFTTHRDDLFYLLQYPRWMIRHQDSQKSLLEMPFTCESSQCSCNFPRDTIRSFPDPAFLSAPFKTRASFKIVHSRGPLDFAHGKRHNFRVPHFSNLRVNSPQSNHDRQRSLGFKFNFVGLLSYQIDNGEKTLDGRKYNSKASPLFNIRLEVL